MDEPTTNELLTTTKSSSSKSDVERAMRIIVENGGFGNCTCDEAFSKRELTDPHCQWCDWGKGVQEDIAAALGESYALGSADAHQLADHTIQDQRARIEELEEALKRIARVDFIGGGDWKEASNQWQKQRIAASEIAEKALKGREGA